MTIARKDDLIRAQHADLAHFRVVQGADNLDVDPGLDQIHQAHRGGGGIRALEPVRGLRVGLHSDTMRMYNIFLPQQGNKPKQFFNMGVGTVPFAV